MKINLPKNWREIAGLTTEAPKPEENTPIVDDKLPVEGEVLKQIWDKPSQQLGFKPLELPANWKDVAGVK